MPGDANPFAAGNPTGGRPRNTPEMLKVRDNARASSQEMLDVLLAIARDTTAAPRDRAAAADKVLDRALGRPAQSVEGTDDGPAIRLNFGPTIMIPPESAD